MRTKRLAARQTVPRIAKAIPFMPAVIAFEISASSQTMEASEPLSSITVFLITLPVSEATALNAWVIDHVYEVVPESKF
jgi:hypothetical protein